MKEQAKWTWRSPSIGKRLTWAGGWNRVIESTLHRHSSYSGFCLQTKRPIPRLRFYSSKAKRFTARFWEAIRITVLDLPKPIWDGFTSSKAITQRPKTKIEKLWT